MLKVVEEVKQFVTGFFQRGQWKRCIFRQAESVLGIRGCTFDALHCQLYNRVQVGSVFFLEMFWRQCDSAFPLFDNLVVCFTEIRVIKRTSVF